MTLTVRNTDGETDVRLSHLVAELQERVPPHSQGLDIGKQGWLGDVFGQVFAEMLAMADREPPLQALLDAISAIVINYESPSERGDFGGRHTATQLNLAKVRGNPTRKYPLDYKGQFPKQNHLFFRGNVSEVRRQTAERAWRSNWFQYIRLDAEIDLSAQEQSNFTVNNMVLRHSSKPQPVLLTWDDAVEDGVVQPFMPLATLHLSKRGQDPWKVKTPNAQGFPIFVRQFARMFNRNGMGANDDLFGGRDQETLWRINEETVGVMLNSFFTHFSQWGSNTFITIPVRLNVNPRSKSGVGELDADLRAAVSVFMTAPRENDFFQESWRFFEAFANRILTSILASEFMAMSQIHWERERKGSVHLASHPIARKIRPALNAQLGVMDIADQIRDELEGDPTAWDVDRVRQLSEDLSERTRSAITNVSIVDGVVNLMGLLLDFGDDMRRMIESNLKAPATAGDARGLDLMMALRDAEKEVRDKDGATRRVQIVGLGEHNDPTITLKPRFRGPKRLEDHSEREPLLYKALFCELLQNAANYGYDPADPTSAVVPVSITYSPQHLQLKNFVRPIAAERAEKAASDINNRDEGDRLSSGLFFAKKVLNVMQIGELHIKCTKVDNPHEGDPPEVLEWVYTIELEEF